MSLIIKKILAVHPSVTDDSTARRIRALLVASVVSFCALATLFLLGLNFDVFVTRSARNGIVVGMVCALLSVMLLRSSYHKFGFGLFISVLMFLVQARPWTSIPFDRVIAGMMFVSLIQIIAVLVFTFRVAVMVMAVNIVLMTIPWFVKPEYRVITFPITVICTIFQSVFLAILSKINQSERDIAAQLSAENAVGEILAGIAHGINSPLSAVRTIGARLDRKLGLGELTLDAARVLVIKMLRAVDRTLILSKALQNYVEQVPNGDQKRFDLQMACREATQFCVAAFDLESVKINLDFPESQVLISAPRDRVVHAISSLLSSCYKNLSASSNSEINIGIEVVGCSAVVRVGDTGKASLDALVDTVENPLKHRTGIEKGGDLEIRMARKLFEMCAARFEVGKDPVRDKFRATWELAS